MCVCGKTPLQPGPFGVVTPQDPDIAALVARLGLRGMHYRSFGNRPVSSPSAVPPSDAPDAAMGAPPVTGAAPSTPPAVAPMSIPAAGAPAPASPGVEAPPSLSDFPLLAAALGVAPSTSAPAPTEATLVFLGLRTSRTTQGH
ncbi:hypothetical protein Rmf_18530 [Roseomonas fluvialis]|uniref:Uncharacterized protein n=1 Tax=Roseomonas fluvialis TaxID=1750527 RepID=A0ABN6P029_9PROT|nr:hypothetical protein Rmf_18530 [Roseomonas fluvialis]